MCKRGEIIFINEYRHHEKEIFGHPFVVLSDEAGKVCGIDFDLVCLVMSSFKDEEQRKRKLTYPGNFPVSASEKTLDGMDNLDAYIKANQFYYFDSSITNFTLIGSLDIDAWTALLTFIETLSQKGIAIEQIIDNLKQQS